VKGGTRLTRRGERVAAWAFVAFVLAAMILPGAWLGVSW
jgi:hypothetical protein